MNKKKPLIIVFLITIMLSIFVNNIFASEINYNFTETIVLYDKAVSYDLTLYNASNESQLYTINTYTTPFEVTLIPETIRLAPRERGKITFLFEPLLDQLESVYSSNFRITSNNEIKTVYFNINQKSNKVCPLDLRINNVINDDNLSFILRIENTTTKNYNLELIDLENIKDFNKSSITSNREETIEREFVFSDFNRSLQKTVLIYKCNNIQNTKEIEIPKKEIEDTIDENTTDLTGFIGFADLSFLNVFFQSVATINFGFLTVFYNSLISIDFMVILNSTITHIILIVILIFLILSFTTRYIKYLYNLKK